MTDARSRLGEPLVAYFDIEGASRALRVPNGSVARALICYKKGEEVAVRKRKGISSIVFP